MPIINTALTLQDLPPPPPDTLGWPWTKQSQPLPERMLDGSEWPRISVVTPSYNQAQFIEETIRSVLLQGYPNLEYIIIDGGSTDSTLEILQKYDKYLAYWVSEPDAGQANALNKGFHKATGELIGWQNSDDYYYRDCFRYAAEAANLLKDVDIVYGSTNYVDQSHQFSLFIDGAIHVNEQGASIGSKYVSDFNLLDMIPYANMCNQSMFFKRKIFKDGNFIDESFKHAMDYEFFWRLIARSYKFQLVPEMMGYYRLHDEAKGCQLDNSCTEEMSKVYKSVYQNVELPLEVKEKLWLYIRGSCLDNYGKLRLHLFQNNFKELIALRGFAALDVTLLSRYLISLLGVKNLEIVRKIKNLFKREALTQ